MRLVSKDEFDIQKKRLDKIEKKLEQFSKTKKTKKVKNP